MKGLKLSILAVVATASMYLVSCTSEPCKNVSCLNSGVATASTDNKSCACACTGNYEGDSCQTKGNTKYAGNWNISEKLNGAATALPSYTSEVTAEAGDAVTIYFKDLGFYTCTTGSYRVKATVAKTAVTISNFTTCGTEFNGTGTYTSSTQMSLNYTAKYGTPTKTDNFVAALSK